MGICMSHKSASSEANSPTKITPIDNHEIKKVEEIKFSKSDFIFEKSGNFRDAY